MSTGVKTVLITGCSAGGIGHALAHTYHQAGLRVIATARRLDSMTDLAEAGMTVLELDVTDESSVRSVKDRVTELTGGTLDLLVNNAGQASTLPAIDLTLPIMKAAFDVNVFGAMLMVHEFAPLLIASKKNPTIVFIGSIAAVIPVPFSASYNATKSALHAYANTLRIELAPFGVNVATMVTGAVKSNIAKPVAIPENSFYKPMDDLFQKTRVGFSQRNAMDTFDYAKVVVRETLKVHPKASVWSGNQVWTAWIASTFLPLRLIGWIASKRFGLIEFAKRISTSKKSD